MQFGVDVHVSLFLGVGAILDRSGPRHARVPECGSGGHEKGVVDVPRVGEYREVERQEPGFAPRDDAEVRRLQRGVREDVVQRRAVVVLEIVQGGCREIRVRGGRTVSYRPLFSVSLYRTRGQKEKGRGRGRVDAP